MGSNKAFVTASSYGIPESKTVLQPIDLNKVNSAIAEFSSSKKLAWWDAEQQKFGYLPFLVYVHSRPSATKLEIQFVDCDTGLLVVGQVNGGKHEIDLDDLNLVHRGSPTSLIADGWPQPNDPRIIILMMNNMRMSEDMFADASNSNAWPQAVMLLPGKWPETQIAAFAVNYLKQVSSKIPVAWRRDLIRFLGEEE